MNGVFSRRTKILLIWMGADLAGTLFLSQYEFFCSLFLLSSVLAVGWLFWETFDHICDPRENEIIEILEHKYPLTYKALRTLRRKGEQSQNVTWLHEIIADLRVQYPLRHGTKTRLTWMFVRYVFLVSHFSALSFLMMRLGWPIEFKHLTSDSTYWKHFYYHVVTMTTVGYGDIAPLDTSYLARGLIIGELLLTFLFIINLVNFFQGAARLTIENFKQAIGAYFRERVRLKR